MIPDLVARYEAGETSVQLGRALGLRPERVIIELHKAGAAVRPRGSNKLLTDEKLEQIRALYVAGEKIEYIAACSGVSTGSVNRALAPVKARHREVLRQLADRLTGEEAEALRCAR